MHDSKSFSSPPLEDEPTAHRVAHNPLPDAEDHSAVQTTKSPKKSPKTKITDVIFGLALLLTIYLVARWLPTLHPVSQNPASAATLNPVSNNAKNSPFDQLPPTYQLPKPSATVQPSSTPIPAPTPTTAEQTSKVEVAQLYQGSNKPDPRTQQQETPATLPNPTSPAAFSTPTPLSAPVNPNRPTGTLPETSTPTSTGDSRPAENSTASTISQRFEETSLAMQQVDVALFPKASGLTSQALRLNVPIVHEKQLLSLTASDFTKLREIVARIQDTRVKQLALQQEISTELNDYNAIIRKGTPEAVLNADSPSLINNGDQQ
jgi:hypothetical protein